MEQNKYHQILVHHAMPSGQRIFGADGHAWWFMQDNDPKQTSNKVKSHLASKQNDNKSNMKVMEWPSQSPDLNPLELLWEECDRQVKKRKPTNLHDLEDAVKDVWTNMAPEKMEKLINRMPALCEEVIAADGGYFVEKAASKNAKRRKNAKETVY